MDFSYNARRVQFTARIMPKRYKRIIPEK
jgi:hypothetical protein